MQFNSSNKLFEYCVMAEMWINVNCVHIHTAVIEEDGFYPGERLLTRPNNTEAYIFSLSFFITITERLIYLKIIWMNSD